METVIDTGRTRTAIRYGTGTTTTVATKIKTTIMTETMIGTGAKSLIRKSAAKRAKDSNPEYRSDSGHSRQFTADFQNKKQASCDESQDARQPSPRTALP